MDLQLLEQAVRTTGCAWNAGAGGEYIIMGTRQQIEAMADKLTDAQTTRIGELEREAYRYEQMLLHRDTLMAAVPACPEHGPGCVPHALEWVQQMRTTPTDAMWVASINRRAEVEQLMFDAARGKRPMPTPEELRAWALKLGTVHEHIAAAKKAKGEQP